MADSIKVLCRFRPQNSREKAANAYIVVQVSDDHTLCAVTHPDKSKQPKPVSFNFDCVFDWTSTQTEVYEHAASHLVEQIFDGFNATIFAYGQTGAGKTYSMEGKLGSPHRGIVPRTVQSIFECISDSDENMEYLLQVSYVEIYLEQLRDLLRPGNGKMKIRDGKTGVYIENVTEMYVRDAQEVIDLMEMGSRSRTTNATQMNATSSRSHGVFMLKLTQTNTTSGTKKISKLMMIDLAGSEKVSKTGARGTLLKEAQKINQSLSALGNVMAQLSSGKSHISYRDSVLTRLLSDSLGGNCKTTLLVAVSPSSFNADETITTCRFGVRAKKIKNKAKINAEKTVAEYKKEVIELNDKIKKLQVLVKALQSDLYKAKLGEIKENDIGDSDKIIDMIDMDYIMDDGKSKKKKTKKKKGFFRPGCEPKFDSRKKSKAKSKSKSSQQEQEVEEEEKKDSSHSNSSSIEEVMSNNDENTQELIKKLTDAEERAETAEQHIKYLEAELIKAQAAAANNLGLADIEPAPSPRKRVSILPAPHRPRASLPSTSSNLLNNNVSSHSQLSQLNSLPIPNETPKMEVDRVSLIRKDFDFEIQHGNLEMEKNIVLTNTVIEMPSHLADLDPALLEQARRGLQLENYDLRKQMEQLVHELDQYRIRIQKKNEQLKFEKNTTEDAEMECDRLLLQQQVLEERIQAFEDDRQRERKQIENFKNENQIYKIECEQLKQKLQLKQNEIQETIIKISKREAKRADDFMQQAIKQFKKLQIKNQKQKQQETQETQFENFKKNNPNLSSYAIMNIEQQQKELNKQRQIMEQQMQQLKQATFEQLERIQFEQMKIKSALQSKIEECISLNMLISDKNDEIKTLLKKLKLKDTTLHRQGNELKAFGDLKLKSDQIHQKEYKKSQDTIFNLKKQLAKLQRINHTNQNFKNNNGSALLNHKRTVIPTPIKGGGRKNKNNNKNKNKNVHKNINHPNKQSITAQFFNQNMRKGSGASLLPQYNYKSPLFGAVNSPTPTNNHLRQESKRHNHNNSNLHTYKKSNNSYW